MGKRYRVGVLGCTGLVGQRIIEQLWGHPQFEISKLFARRERKGKKYGAEVKWVCASELDPVVAGMTIDSMDDMSVYKGLDLVLSALPADIAVKLEGELRENGCKVVSNAKSYRMHDDVPLLVPEVNAESLELVEAQMKKYNGGFIATNPNCSTIGIILAIGPVEREIGISSLHITTLQSVSGAGLNGLSAYEAIANVIPNISGEEEKIRVEIPKILSRKDLDIKVRVNRVPVADGHTFNIWFKTGRNSSVNELLDIWKKYKPVCGKLSSISKSSSIYTLYEEQEFMPQPRLDAWKNGGMGTAIGRVEPVSLNEFCLTAVSNNIVRGAAGGTVIIAESLLQKGYI